MNISVVIPLYNKELYIQRAIKSVLFQKSPANEIIIIDDGSTDHSAEIVKRIVDQRIKYIKQENAGECAARNRGITEAQNDIVALLDADDEWKPDFLDNIQQLAEKFPGCGIYATAYEVHQPNSQVYLPKLSNIPHEPWKGLLEDIFRIFQKAPPFYSSSVAVAKTLCLDEGGFPVGVKRGGDIMMWVKMAIKYPVAFSPSRQVIYHTEAINRACNVFPSEEESECAKEIASLLEKNLVPKEMVEDLREYYAWLNIRKAREILISGNRLGARTLIKKAGFTKKYRLDYLWWLFCSQPLPARGILKIRGYIKTK